MTSRRLLLLVMALAVSCQGLSKLKVLHSWDSIDYHWPSHHPNATRQVMIKLGLFIPGNSIIFDVDWWNGRVFVTTPRLKPGVPATLSTVSPYGDELNPVLHPYPNWSWHRPGDCDGITSVSSIQVDECGFLWVLDTGNVGDTLNTKTVCPKKLVVFRLSSDKMIRVHRFPDNTYDNESELKSIVVEVDKTGDKCRPMFAYIADSTGSGLIVYDRKRDRSWRVNANNFHPIPAFGHFSVAGTEFDKMVGLYGLALSPHSDTDPRTLYYHSLASNTEGHVATSVLKHEELFNRTVTPATMKEFKTFATTRDGQASTQAMDGNGVLFFSYLSKMTLNCWRSDTPYDVPNIVEIDKDEDLLQFVSSTKVVKKKDGTEDLLVVSNRFQKVIGNSLNVKEKNFRIMKASINDLIANTKCKK